MNAFVLTSSMAVQIRQSFARPMFRFCLLVNPVMNTILLYHMFQNAQEADFFSYVVLGSGLMAVWSCICFSSAGDINRERYSGTLALIFAAPAGFPAILLGKILGNTVLSLASLAISLVTALAVYRIALPPLHPLYCLVALPALITSFVAVSLVLACLLTLSRRTTLYMNCIEIPFELLCGFAFPITVLPGPLQAVSRALPPTWAVTLLHMAVQGVEQPATFWHTLAVLLALTGLTLLLAWWLYCRIDVQVRRSANLEVY